MSAFLSRLLAGPPSPGNPPAPRIPEPLAAPVVSEAASETAAGQAAPEPAVSAPVPILPPCRGLDWGAYFFRFDYDYLPNLRPMERSTGGRQIAARINRDSTRIHDSIKLMNDFAEPMSRIRQEADPADPSQPHWFNDSWMPSLDAAMLYTLVAHHRPATYFEVGSGNSTKFVRRAIRDHGLSTRIVSIDPQPRAEVDNICDEVIRARIEETDIEAIAARAQPGDVVFVDNSHRSFPGSDVTVSLMEWMPALPAGTIFGVHDICLPFDYHECYKAYFYNEQYMLGMYLLGGALNDTILMPTYYAQRVERYDHALALLQDRIGLAEHVRGGASLWIELGPRPTPAG